MGKIRFAVCLGFFAISPGAAGDPAAPSLSTCLIHAQHFGMNGGRHNWELPLCYDTIKQVADPRAIRLSSNGQVEAVGYQGMIFVRLIGANGQADRVHVFTGTDTGLANVKSIALNERDRTVLALNYTTTSAGAPVAELLAFPWDRCGDLLPIRAATPAELTGASALAVDPTGQQLYAVFSDGRSVLTFSALANAAGRSPASASQVTGWIRGEATLLSRPVDAAIDGDDRLLLIADTQAGAVLSFPFGGVGDVPPASQVPFVVTGHAQLVGTRYDHESHSVIAILSDGSTQQFQLPTQAQANSQ